MLNLEKIACGKSFRKIRKYNNMKIQQQEQTKSYHRKIKKRKLNSFNLFENI